MFATLTGRLPEPPRGGHQDPGDESSATALRAVLAAQETAGLELLSDAEVQWPSLTTALLESLGVAAPSAASSGGRRRPAGGTTARPAPALGEPRWSAPITIDAWQRAAAASTIPVRATIIGPYTLGWELEDRRGRAPSLDRRRLTLALADALGQELRALAAAGCPFVDVVEDSATRIGDHVAERDLFRSAQRRLISDVEGLHLSLTIRGGSVDTAGAATILDAPYRSYLFDFVAGPDNWRIARQVPGDRGIICGALDPRPAEHPAMEEIVWAAQYAATSNGRGPERVGLAPASGLDACTWEEAGRRMALLGEAARLATASPEEIGRRLDPRAVDIRSAAFGRYAPDTRRTTERRMRGPDRTA